MEGGKIRPPQVENVLNRPGEIGLNLSSDYNLKHSQLPIKTFLFQLMLTSLNHKKELCLSFFRKQLKGKEFKIILYPLP